MSINFNVYFWECLLGIIIFSFAILVPLYMNPLWWIHDYPKDIQERYFENHDRIPTEPFSIVVLIKKGCALILALGVLVGLVALAGAKSFLRGFLLSYGIWFLIDWYDCFVLDWIFFANIKKIRIYASNEPKSVLARDLGDYRDNLRNSRSVFLKLSVQRIWMRHIIKRNTILYIHA